MLSYRLIRSRRKTAAIHITKDAAVEVRAPLKMPKAYIDEFVALKEKWIIAHLARRELLNSEKAAFSLNYGDTATLCGKAYPILAKDTKHAGFDGACFYLPPGLSPDDIRRIVVRIYKTEAKRVIGSRVDEYSERMNVKPSSVRITSAKTRWGSCSGKNGLSFSWRLIMADESVIDYVVAHELAHITEHNHSPRFWAVVEGVLPDYKQRRLKLKALQDSLAREDWG